MRRFLVILMAILLAAPASAMANADIQELEKQVQELTKQIKRLSKSVRKSELHAATDRIKFSGDLRVKADTLHYKDVTMAPGSWVDFDDFKNKAFSGAFGDMTDPSSPLSGFIGTYLPILAPGVDPTDMAQVQAALMGMGGVGAFLPYGKKTYDINNDVVYTTRLRLNMNAKVWNNVSFAGRLSMYKNWGDSTGTKVFDSWNAFTMDGTNSGNTTDDSLHVERAYFNWKDIGGSNFYLSIGRRPSTYGPPGHIRENEMRGGTPSGHLVNFNFDGITIGYKLEDITGIEGQTVRFCYGQGFESEWGNGELFNEINTEDTHLGGFNIDALNDGTNLLQFTLFRALDVTDGFKGTIAFPTQFAALMAPTMFQDLQNFPNFNFVTRVQPSTTIGDITLGGIGFTREEYNGVKWFTSLGWTQTDPNGKFGMFGGLLSDPVYEAFLDTDEEGNDFINMAPVKPSNDDKKDGYSIYVGVQVPAPMGKFGLEYNYGSKYWTPFTQAQDDMIGSKLATRGHVGEAYYIFDINPKMFIKIGGLYYDYEYTGSGSPVGEPRKIEDVKDGKAVSMLPAIDKAWDGYASLTIQF